MLIKKLPDFYRTQIFTFKYVFVIGPYSGKEKISRSFTYYFNIKLTFLQK